MVMFNSSYPKTSGFSCILQPPDPIILFSINILGPPTILATRGHTVCAEHFAGQIW